MNTPFANTLYYGDCLDIMAGFPDSYIDLICLDPPFNSNEKYNKVFKDSGLRIDPQIKAFDDVWLWDDTSAERVERVKNAVANPASKVIAGFEGFIPRSKMLSYTSYMAERLFMMHRILKNKGSIYLHCDPYASHYLKLIMDTIFGEKNFQNEVIWYYKNASRGKKRLAKAHDAILWYSKTPENYVFNRDDILVPFESGMTEWRYTKGGQTGQEMPKGKTPDDVIIMPALNAMAKERLDYPTQKPLALYERIIKASSNPGDLVLDPFAGCGTTIEAAAKNGRDVIGIDILPFALRLINRYRLAPNGITPLPIEGVPVDMDTARQLAKTVPFKFQDWAISLIDGLASNPQKVGDDGIDGFGVFLNPPDNMDRKAIIVQVTGASGSQKAKFDRLHASIRNENAAMGILITLDAQTAQRNWKHTLGPIKMGETTYAPIQCFSIEEYYRNDERWDRILTLPSLANPWTGKHMQQKILFDE
ncbi:MAG: site-specific DNA-methyltransferase [Candidatus Poribacteria bacterium]|nr:site-specific DNA-methyltransferase [Candidatus Poribacteria bacterium]